jgi:hypothetical protein
MSQIRQRREERSAPSGAGGRLPLIGSARPEDESGRAQDERERLRRQAVSSAGDERDRQPRADPDRLWRVPGRRSKRATRVDGQSEAIVRSRARRRLGLGWKRVLTWRSATRRSSLPTSVSSVPLEGEQLLASVGRVVGSRLALM